MIPAQRKKNLKSFHLCIVYRSARELTSVSSNDWKRDIIESAYKIDPVSPTVMVYTLVFGARDIGFKAGEH